MLYLDKILSQLAYPLGVSLGLALLALLPEAAAMRHLLSELGVPPKAVLIEGQRPKAKG